MEAFDDPEQPPDLVEAPLAQDGVEEKATRVPITIVTGKPGHALRAATPQSPLHDD
jgi:hypothetical protein